MITEILRILNFMGEAFLHIWPYIVITIPLAVALNLTNVSQHIKKIFDKGPIVSIILATIVGAFSPFCSCGVIPVIASLLIGGVPLAPVMAFWIASPSMDPEIFFLSVGIVGADLAVWRLVTTLLLSLGAGFLTQFLVYKGWIGQSILKEQNVGAQSMGKKVFIKVKQFWNETVKMVKNIITPQKQEVALACCNSMPVALEGDRGVGSGEASSPKKEKKSSCDCKPKPTFYEKLLSETTSASLMVIKFMALAFFIEALIIFYLPKEFITSLLGSSNDWAIVSATLLGVPMYTSNLAALPMVGGLMEQGMSSGAALAFLIAGPTTTLPAMAAVYSIVNKRVFTIYLLITLLGAVSFGYLKFFLG